MILYSWFWCQLNNLTTVFRFARETGNAVRIIILKGNATTALSVISGGFPVIYVCFIRPFTRVQFCLMIFFNTARTIRRNLSVLIRNILWLLKALCKRLARWWLERHGKFAFINFPSVRVTCLINQSERLGESIYCSSWFNGSLQMRKTILLVIQRSQKPLTISIPGMLPALTSKSYASVSFTVKKKQMFDLWNYSFFLFITACIIDCIVLYDNSSDIRLIKVWPPFATPI